MHSFHWWQLFKIYCVTVKKFSLLEALPWANWSWLLFIFRANTISSDQLCGGNKLRHSSQLWTIADDLKQQVSITIRCPPCCRGQQTGFDAVCWYFEGRGRIWWGIGVLRKGLSNSLTLHSVLFFLSKYCRSNSNRRELKLRRETMYLKNENIAIHSWLSNVAKRKKKSWLSQNCAHLT